MGQLTMDGREVPAPPRVRALTERQRMLLRYVRHHGEVRPVEIGQLMHATRESAPRPRFYSSDGADALARLAVRGLVERRARGVWAPVAHEEGWT